MNELEKHIDLWNKICEKDLDWHNKIYKNPELYNEEEYYALEVLFEDWYEKSLMLGQTSPVLECYQKECYAILHPSGFASRAEEKKAIDDYKNQIPDKR